MSHLIVPDATELEFLQNLLDTWGFDVKFNLYKNNYTPVAGSAFANFTVADFTGYVANLGVAFGAPATVAGKGTITASMLTSVQGVPGTTNTIYGYYVYWVPAGPGSEILLWAEKFDTPVVTVNSGDTINVTPVFTLFSEF